MTLRRISGINTGFRTQAWQIPTMVSNFINTKTKYNNIVSMIRIKALLNFKNGSRLKPDLNFCSPGRFHVDRARGAEEIRKIPNFPTNQRSKFRHVMSS